MELWMTPLYVNILNTILLPFSSHPHIVFMTQHCIMADNNPKHTSKLEGEALPQTLAQNPIYIALGNSCDLTQSK